LCTAIHTCGQMGRRPRREGGQGTGTAARQAYEPDAPSPVVRGWGCPARNSARGRLSRMGCWSAGRGERLRAFNTTRNVACVFDPLEYWPDTMGNGRVVDPPLPVIVDLASLFPLGHPVCRTPSR